MSSKWLVAGFAALTLTAGLNNTRLEQAIKSGDRPSAQSLLKQGADVNAADPDGTTPLHWAAEAGDTEMARMLLRAGANAKARNRYGVTPLSLAASNGNGELVALLLKAGADPGATLPNGETILMKAARSGNPEAVRLLIERGSDVNARESSYGQTALMWAAAENHPEAVDLLLEHGAEVDARSNEMKYEQDRFGLEGVMTILPRGHWTALMYAARQGSLDAARALLNAGAAPNLTDPDGTTALVLAIINGHYDTAAMMVEKGADPNIADSAGMAALYAAVDMNTLGEVYGRPARPSKDKLTALDLIRILLEHGANPNQQLLTPTLPRAHTPGESTLAEGATPLMRAAKNGDAAAMRLLLAHGADPSLAQKNHNTALMLAAGLGRGQGVFAKDYATEKELLEAVEVLVERGVDVNAANDRGQTAMHFAVRASDDIVRYLAAHGALLDVKDKQGHTPIDVALGMGVRGRAGGPVEVRQTTADLLRQLMAQNGGERQSSAIK
ncbi:MAG TPA: ankyrin repeat domain-containing protein [Bryobacteraceae bacterium]|nr:ankyrin repeat domain-containing protein [Bryobacteraceae bacterium]